MTPTRWVNPRCGDCGLFTSWDADSYTPFGCANPDDPEPYDPEYFCPRCAEKAYHRCVAHLLKHGIPSEKHRPYWQSPRFYWLAVAVVRSKRKHGLAVLPVRHEDVRYEWPWMPNAKGVTRVWCACGRSFATSDDLRLHARESRTVAA